MSASVGVLGGGPWGHALALAASRTGASVALFSRRATDAAPGVRLTTDFAELARARLIVVAVPTQVVRDVARQLAPHLDGSFLLVHGVRGLSGSTLATVSDILRDETPVRRLGALGGPVQVDELEGGRPSALVCGSRFPEVSEAVARAFQSRSLRVFPTPDLRGVEWGSALVGCLSIGVGFVRGAGQGPGIVAALIARAVDEAAKLAAAAGAEERTLLGLAGYGDLLASIALEARPEVVLGAALASGKTLDEAKAQARLRVEAIELLPRVVAFAKEHRIQAPIFAALADILGGLAPEQALARFFSFG